MCVCVYLHVPCARVHLVCMPYIFFMSVTLWQIHLARGLIHWQRDGKCLMANIKDGHMRQELLPEVWSTLRQISFNFWAQILHSWSEESQWTCMYLYKYIFKPWAERGRLINNQIFRRQTEKKQTQCDQRQRPHVLSMASFIITILSVADVLYWDSEQWAPGQLQRLQSAQLLDSHGSLKASREWVKLWSLTRHWGNVALPSANSNKASNGNRESIYITNLRNKGQGRAKLAFLSPLSLSLSFSPCLSLFLLSLTFNYWK